jgi:hypothetical protein
LFPGLQNESCSHVRREVARVPERVLTLPSRSSMGEMAENAREEWLKNGSERLKPERKAEFSDTSYHPDFGRSPPECR